MLAEKKVEVSLKASDHLRTSEELYAINPYGELPVLVDRGVALYRSNVIMEYLEDRYPQPRLLPLDPLERARARILVARVEKDWYSAMDILDFGSKIAKDKARIMLRDGLTAISPLFKQQDYMLGPNYTMVDCALSPILWRLSYFDVQLPTSAAPLLAYATRLFDRKAFVASLTTEERGLNE